MLKDKEKILKEQEKNYLSHKRRPQRIIRETFKFKEKAEMVSPDDFSRKQSEL